MVVEIWQVASLGKIQLGISYREFMLTGLMRSRDLCGARVARVVRGPVCLGLAHDKNIVDVPFL
jgi:hypothetical protein